MAAGWLLFFAGGVGCALVYVLYLYDRLPSSGWLQGVTYAIPGPFLVSSLAFFPLLSIMHPLIRAGQARVPGFWGLGLSGGRGALANFLGHCLFGFIVGVFYRKPPVFSGS